MLSLSIAFIVMTAAESFLGLDVARTLAGPKASSELVASLNRELGLAQPFWERIVKRAVGALSGDLGHSFTYQVPVTALLGEALGQSARALWIALLIGIVAGIPLGVWASYGNTMLSGFFLAVGSSFALLPSIIPATLVVYVFGFRLGWPIPNYAVSVALIACTPVAVIALAMATEFRKILLSDHVKFARSLGYSELRLIAVNLKIGFPGLANNLSSVVLYLVTATVFVEIIFSEPGLGTLLLNATGQLDYPVILAFALLMVLLIGSMNIFTGIVLYVMDPRTQS